MRELRNAIEHGALMARGGAISPQHLPPPTHVLQSTTTAPEQTLRDSVCQWAQQQLIAAGRSDELYQRFLNATEPALFDAVLAATSNNRAQAAAMLGIHRATLRKKLGGDTEHAN